jgi:hypothetical protein
MDWVWEVVESIRSLPMRERGLKSISNFGYLTGYKSLPMRERGLKSPEEVYRQYIPDVAPHAGAWIEIYKKLSI